MLKSYVNLISKLLNIFIRRNSKRTVAKRNKAWIHHRAYHLNRHRRKFHSAVSPEKFMTTRLKRFAELARKMHIHPTHAFAFCHFVYLPSSFPATMRPSLPPHALAPLPQWISQPVLYPKSYSPYHSLSRKKVLSEKKQVKFVWWGQKVRSFWHGWLV